MTTRVEKVTIGALIKGYDTLDDDRVVGWDRKLNITPSYQREFIRDGDVKWQKPLIQSIWRGRPINLVYFAEDERGMYNLLDGQQRIRTICDFIKDNAFPVELELGGESYIYRQIQADPDMHEQFMNYELFVCLCEGGSDEEYMRWFKTINTGAQELTPQEMRNALCDGPWVADAKTYFSSKLAGEVALCNDLLGKNRNRQQHLERVLRWRLDTDDGEKILVYMQRMRDKPNADDLWGYYMQVHGWVAGLFDVASSGNAAQPAGELKRHMRAVDWGHLYEKYGTSKYDYDPEYTRQRARELQCHPDIRKKSGVYEYILGREKSENLLDVKAFDDETKERVWLEQGRRCADPPEVQCPNPQDELPWEDAEADHRKPWSKGGRTHESNCQVLCRACNRAKGAKMVSGPPSKLVTQRPSV